MPPVEQPPPPPTDDLLLEAFQRGDEAAWRAVVDRYETRIIGFLRGYTDDLEVARDLCQETFVRLLRRPPRSTHDDSLGPWLLKVAYRLAVDHARRQRRIQIRARRQKPVVDPQSAEPDPATLAANQDERRRLRAAVAALPEDLRAVVQARLEPHEPTFAQLARRLGIPRGTALWRMRRAIEDLRKTTTAAETDSP